MYMYYVAIQQMVISHSVSLLHSDNAGSIISAHMPGDLAGHRFTEPKSQVQYEFMLVIDPHPAWIRPPGKLGRGQPVGSMLYMSMGNDHYSTGSMP